jgi:3-methyl-2-oxobutanoate hydroxymethyltransferase
MNPGSGYADVAARPARLTVPALHAMAREGTRIAMLTCYDASFATQCERGGVDALLIGDSLGMVIQGRDTTLAVTLADTLYHTRCVAAGCARPLLIADLPFGSYQASPEAAYAASAAALQAGAQMVKLEGGTWLAPTIEFLVRRGIPVCGHVGLQPQSVNVLGGYRVQGRSAAAGEALVADARALGAAGCGLLVVECVPRALTPRLEAEAAVPVIGIGAGPCALAVLSRTEDAIRMIAAFSFRMDSARTYQYELKPEPTIMASTIARVITTRTVWRATKRCKR